jgi:hypothetical protein
MNGMEWKAPVNVMNNGRCTNEDIDMNIDKLGLSRTN